MIEFSYESPFGTWQVKSIEPPPHLAQFIETFWETSGNVSYGYEKLLPGGCADFMINLGPPQMVLDRAGGNIARTHTKAWLSGIHSAPLFAAPAHSAGVFRTHFVGASLRPQGVKGIFGIDAIDVANRVFDVEDILGPGVVSIRDRVGESLTTMERFRLMADFLMSVSEEHSRPVAQGAIWAMEQTLARSGDVQVAQLCKDLGVSRKHLNSMYKSCTGLSPKLYARLIRFKSLIDDIQNPEKSWVHLAAVRGYFDQSHLIRDFKEFAGEPPVSLIESCSPDGKGVNYDEFPKSK